jgi:hypothetical protein
VASSGGVQRAATHELYLELAEFTGSYLIHQDVEERTVTPALCRVVGPDAMMAIHAAIIARIPRDEMARGLAFMLPAMNLDDRSELLGDMRAAAPAPVFEGVWGLAASSWPRPITRRRRPPRDDLNRRREPFRPGRACRPRRGPLSRNPSTRGCGDREQRPF